MPRSRVEKANRKSYSCTFTTHFTKAAIEALREPEDSICAPLGLLHGFPCYLRLYMMEVAGWDGRLGLLLFSNIQDKDESLDTPEQAEWGGQDDDGKRGFDFTVVRGTVGAADVKRNKAYNTTTTLADHIFIDSPDVLVNDMEDKLNVELELKVYQHKHC